jgi:hypothetical protein
MGPEGYDNSPTVRRHDDGRVEILTVPAKASFSHELVALAEVVVRDGDLLTLCGQVQYRIVGEDRYVMWGDLLAERISDGRGGPLPPIAEDA